MAEKAATFGLHIVTVQDDLDSICAQMQPGKWGTDNEMTSYRPESLKEFLGQDGLLLLAKHGEKIAGAALCYELPHPAGEDSLYIHELDTHPEYRRQGVATALMRKLMEIAKDRELEEVWVGTETNNDTANAFYKSLEPYETEPSIIYAYKAAKG